LGICEASSESLKGSTKPGQLQPMRRDREDKLGLADIGGETGAATYILTIVQPGRRPKRLDRVIQAGLLRAAVAKIVLTPIGEATPREICHAHHLDDHHWVHRRCDREVRHARKKRTLRIHSHNNSWDSRSFFSHLSSPGDRLVSRGRRGWPNWSSGRRDNHSSDLGIHCWPPPPVFLACVDGIPLDPQLQLTAS
jgi:hypothetical protein